MKLIPNPSFCYITPTSYLHTYAATSNTHLVLAHLVDKNDEYATFYNERSNSGDFIMMDNSAYELKKPYEPKRLVSLAQKCGAHAVVLPDYPFQPSAKTIEAAVQYIPVFKDVGLKTFFVPQSKVGELEDWISGYAWAAVNDNIDIIGYSILGIPNAMPYIDPAYARVVMAMLLKDRGIYAFHKHNHYLGLNAGPGLELPSLLKMGVLDTVDSSGPVWSAILGHQYTLNSDSLQSTRKINLPVDFSAPYSKDGETHRRIKNNIELTQSLFQTNNSQRVWYAQDEN